MAAAKMRHFNSPEELALRAGQPVTATNGKEFRHYNHPEEVAKRAAAGQASTPVASPRSRSQARLPEQWPPAGEPNNAPVETPAVLVDAQPPEPNEKPDTVPPPALGRTPSDQRLRRLEDIVFTLVESTAEARHFRMLLSNQQAVTDSQQNLINRVRAIELAIEEADEDEDEGADEGAELPALPGDDATPTLDVNGKTDDETPEGA